MALSLKPGGAGKHTLLDIRLLRLLRQELVELFLISVAELGEVDLSLRVHFVFVFERS